MLRYFNEIKTADGLTLSIDNVVMDWHISGLPNRDALMHRLESLSYRFHVDLKHWTDYRIGCFKNQFVISLNDGNSFWLGVGLNQSKTDYARVRMDFNPNKVANHLVFRELLTYIHSICRSMHTDIPRYDLAIDIPAERSDVFLVKDRRVYFERLHGKEYTQYLGRKSHPGHVKLYNKQVESKLPHPLTRLELTLKPLTPYEKMKLPVVYFIRDRQQSFESSAALGSVTETDRFILEAVLEDLSKLNTLGRRKREKIEQLLTYFVDKVTISEKDFRAIDMQLYRFLRYDPGFPTCGDYGEVNMDEKLTVSNATDDVNKDEQSITINFDDFVEIEDDGSMPFSKN